MISHQIIFHATGPSVPNCLISDREYSQWSRGSAPDSCPGTQEDRHQRGHQLPASSDDHQVRGLHLLRLLQDNRDYFHSQTKTKTEKTEGGISDGKYRPGPA